MGFRNDPDQAARLITFSGRSCTDGYLVRRDVTVPGNDGLINFWVNIV